MRIQSLELKRFRAAFDLSLDLGARRVLVTGRNASGKSTIKEAIRWILLGHCTGTDARGLGWESLVPKGESEVSASATFDGLGTVSRQYAGSSKSFQVEGVTGESGIHQQAVFARLDTAPAYLEAVLETAYFFALHHKLAKDTILALTQALIAIGDEKLTLDQVDKAYQKYFEDRADAKRKAKTFGTVVEPTPETLPSLEQVITQMKKLSDRGVEVSRELGRINGRREELGRQLTAVKERKPPVIHVEPEGDSEENAALDTRIRLLTEHNPSQHGCVLDGKVPCETKKALFTRRANELKRTQEKVVEPVQADEIRWVNDLPEPEADPVWLKQQADEIGAIEAQLKELPDTAKLETELIELHKRLRKGEELRDRVKEHARAIAEFERRSAEWVLLEKQIADLEEKCELYGPNGARVGALRQAIGEFERKINVYTQRWGWTLIFVVEPWGVLVNDRPIETYSESEQFRIGIGLQLAIAEASGLGFCVVDRIDMLDVENRRLASDMIMTSPVAQVIMLATREPEQKLPKSNKDLYAYRLGADDAGRTTLIEKHPTVS